MKYIKIYEYNKKLEIGDYILLNNNDGRWNIDTRVKILEILYDNRFYIESFLNINNKKVNFWIYRSDIDRKLTLEEIKDLKIKQDAKKYNL